MKLITLLFFTILITDDVNALGNKLSCKVNIIDKTAYSADINIQNNNLVVVKFNKKNKSMGSCKFVIAGIPSLKFGMIYNLKKTECISGYNLFKKKLEIAEKGFIKLVTSKNTKSSKAFLHIFKKHQTQNCLIKKMNLKALKNITSNKSKV